MAEEFIGGETCCLILGDNLFYGQGLIQLLRKAASIQAGAKIFAYEVRDPTAYGVVTFDGAGVAVALDEKPAEPNSHFAIPGLYFYDRRVCELARRLTPSPRGELEITDLNRIYLDEGNLQVELFGRGTAWLDTGTPENLHDASSFVATIEKRTGLKVSCPEEIALRQNWISTEQVALQAGRYATSEYGRYLKRLALTD